VAVTSASFGLIAVAVSGSKVAATVTPTVEAYINNSRVTADDISVSGVADPKVDLFARGLSVSSGASVGVSIASAIITPTITAYVGGGGDSKMITANTLSVQANQRLPSTGPSAKVRATGSAGGLLLGVDATVTRVTNTSTVLSYIKDGSTLDIQGGTNVIALNNTKQVADSSSDAFGLLAAGITKATAIANTTTHAYLGTNVKLTGGELTISATGADDNYAETTAGAGGVVSGASAEPVTINNSTVTAEIKNSAAGRTIDLSSRDSGALAIAADHTATFNSVVTSNAAGFLSGAGAESDHIINSAVTAGVGDDVSITARSVDIGANNNVDKPRLAGDASNLSGSAKALVGVAGSFSDTVLTLNTNVDIGNADITVVGRPTSDLNLLLHAFNQIDVFEKVTFEAAGLGAGAKVNTNIHGYTDIARVNVDAGARLVSSGGIGMSARGEGTMDIAASAEANGGVGVVVGVSEIDIRPRNEIVIGGNATILANGDIRLSTGRSGDFVRDWYVMESRIDSYSSAAIPVDEIDARAFILQDNIITVNAGALLQSAGDVRLHAERLGVNDVVVGAAGHSWAANLFSAPSAFEKGDSLSASLLHLISEDTSPLTARPRVQSKRIGTATMSTPHLPSNWSTTMLFTTSV
jgi:hypothetical protein